MIANYHTHTFRCNHATGTDREYVEAAIRAGVKDVTIMDGRIPHAILMELLTDEGAGTMILGN